MHRRIRGGAMAWLVVACASAHAAPSLQLDEAGLAPDEIAVSRQLVADAQARLPAAMRDAPGRTISVRWTHALDEQVHGHAGRDELLLNRALLPSLVGTSDAQARHDALATVLHELAHYHDRGAHGGISRDPRFLDLAGWQVRATRFTTQLGGRARENRFVDRSPDPYELTRPAEFFAVNVEHFLLDADYACRRPALHRYFSQRLGSPPGQVAADCARDMAYLDAGEGGVLGTIDPARVYAIDYLLAEGNAQPMSRWGHSMLRLVVCAPGRAPGPDCRLDLAYHRVLSFRAFVDDVQISSWSGLTGRYPSRLFVLPMAQVIDEYTKVELRGLRSIPLKLDRDEVASVLERAAQLHWSYDGRYYFLGNNCAAETWKLLHDGVPRLAGQGIGSITPTGLLRRLEKAGVADASVLDDEAQALRLGYRFASQRTWFQQVYDVARERLDLPQHDVEDWIGLSPQARRPWLERADLRASAALLVLEQAAQRRGDLRVREQLKKRYLRDDARGGPDDAVRRLLRESEALGRPARLIDSSGYGLPQAAEREALARDCLALRDRLRETRAELDRAARGWMTPEQREWMDGIAANADLIGRRVRMLHAEQGGLRLP